VLLAAHSESPLDDATDDAGMIERSGGTVVVVDGDRRNLKITFAGDLTIAEAMLSGGHP
jgi:2-C-methyl-D-erythritol 4-phosphate cytidylyltransferase